MSGLDAFLISEYSLRLNQFGLHIIVVSFRYQYKRLEAQPEHLIFVVRITKKLIRLWVLPCFAEGKVGI